MALFWGNTQIPTSATIKYNGNTVKKVYWNSVLIWQADIKYITCPDCGGSGHTGECYYCNYGECHYCGGSGSTQVTCTNCNGYWPKCTGCGGQGYNWACNVCGTIYSAGISSLPAGAYCGNCYSRTGGIKISDWIELPCEKCYALGALDPDIWGPCQTCGGDGFIGGGQCSYCNGVGGPCRFCGGEHYYSCSTCEGRGQIEEPEENNLGIKWVVPGEQAIIKLARGIEIAWEIDSNDYNNFSSDDCYLNVCSKSGGDLYHWGFKNVHVEMFQGASDAIIYFIDHDCYTDMTYANNCYGNSAMEAEYLVKEYPEWVLAILTYDLASHTYSLEDLT